jgi:ketosteroid isomerase-like protein
MSQENVAIVQRIYEAAARRDEVAAFEVYAEDIVWDMSNWRRAFLYSRPIYHGHEGVRDAWREGLSAFSEIDFEAKDLVDAGDRVLAVVAERERGRASGVPVEASHLAVWTLSDGKVTRLQVFDDRQQALDAVGLRK